jgi:DNA-binding MarR family transcriptional regulator
MWRDVDPRPEERDRPDLSRGTGSVEDRAQPASSNDPRDAFSRDLDLPRGKTRQPVRDRDRSVDLRESEVRILATIGAFRVVPAKDLHDHRGRPSSTRQGELRRLREEGLVEARPYVVGREKTSLVTLTERGRELLERHRRAGRTGPRQEFYARVVKPRELAHDAQLYRAYLQSADRLHRSGAIVRRVALDYELKREYQRFLSELNRDRRAAERDADTAARDVAEWAARRDLPVIDGHVHFPDVRIEYERPDGERKVEDVEVVTPHYRGAYAAAKARTGFSRYRIDTGVGGRGGHSGRSPDPRIFEEFLG